MSFADDYTAFQTRIAAMAPYITLDNTSVIMILGQAFLSSIADLEVALSQSAPNITYTTAAGTALAIKAQDYGVSPSNGTAATISVVFFTQVAPATTITVPIGTIVGTGGDGVTTPSVNFSTMASVVISSGTTASSPVTATCTTTGSIGNVTAGSVVSTSLAQTSGVQVSNALTVGSVSNPNGAGTGGVDPDTDPVIKNKIAARVTPFTTAANAQAAMLAISGIYDVYVFDPLLGSGYIYYYWCDSTGNVSGISGGTPATVADGTYYLATPTLTGTAALVDTALRAVLPFGIVPRIGSYSGSTSQVPFQVEDLSAMTVHFYAPAAVQTSVVTPLIQSGVTTYIQGLIHGQAPTPAGIYAACQAATGQALTNLYVSSSTPALPSGVSTIANTQIWRAINPTITVVRDSS